MDAQDGFLYRKEQKGLDKRLKKGEKTRVKGPAQHDGHQGLLALTQHRIVFVRKAGIGTKMLHWHRGDIASFTVEKKRYGILHLMPKKGKRVSFTFMAHGDAKRFSAAMSPPRPKARVKPSPKPAVRTLRRSDAGTEARDPEGRRAKIEALYQQGILTKSEYEWQIGSLR